MASKLLTSMQVADYLSIGTKEVSKLPLVRVRVSPRRFRYRQEDIDRYVLDRLEGQRYSPGRIHEGGGEQEDREKVGIQSNLLKEIVRPILLGEKGKKESEVDQESELIELTEVVQEPHPRSKRKGK